MNHGTIELVKSKIQPHDVYFEIVCERCNKTSPFVKKIDLRDGRVLCPGCNEFL